MNAIGRTKTPAPATISTISASIITYSIEEKTEIRYFIFNSMRKFHCSKRVM